MTYDEQWPDSPYLSMTDDDMLKGREQHPCWNCQRPTFWIEINFEAPLCSRECVIDKDIEYWFAVDSGVQSDEDPFPAGV